MKKKNQVIMNQYNIEGKLLNDEQFKDLLKLRDSKNDVISKKAKMQIFNHNIGLIHIVVKSYLNLGLEYDDLFQEGAIGLLKAIDAYNIDKSKFSSYATLWIRQRISRAVMEKTNNIKIPENIKLQLMRQNRYEQKFKQEYGKLPTNDNIAKSLGVKVEEVKSIKEVQRLNSVVYINQYINDEEDTELEDFLISFKEQPDTIFEKKALKEEINRILETLPLREKDVIESYFGLNNKKQETLQVIASRYSIAAESVRRIKVRTLKLLDSKFRNKELNVFMN